ncbi:hypothetical protein [Novosphingobium rosa]|uniref:hypothetical protein n=1 Tax=Novosphingobium rosa TaxID=76978 RepID=UPI001471CADD|nr:hypothetical protein [Novosphingobium rosa]
MDVHFQPENLYITSPSGGGQRAIASTDRSKRGRQENLHLFAIPSRYPNAAVLPATTAGEMTRL